MRNFIIGLLIGGSVGSGITYLLCKSHFDKEREKIRKEIRTELKEYYERKQEEEDEAKATHVKTVPDKPIPKKEDEEERKYTEITSQYKTDEQLIEESENTEKLHDALEKEHGDRPKIIKVESFGEITSYDCESLTYYVYDKTLAHEDNSIVDDVAFLLGDALDRYGWADNDEDIDALYVRNYKIQRDFEVVKVFEEYPDK